MATTIIYAETNDAHVESQHSTWAAARAGTGTKSIPAKPLAVGTYLNAGTYYSWQTFLSFDTSGIAGVESATLAVQTYNPNHASNYYVMEARLYDWGTAVEVADFVDGANLGNYTLLATFDTTGLTTQTTAEIPLVFNAVGNAWASAINTSGDTRIFISSSRQRLNTTPTADETATFVGTEATGTADDPRLTIYHGSPTLVGVAQTTWVALSPSTKTTPAFDVEAGDLLIAYAMISDDLSGMYPVAISSSPSLTWSARADNFVGSQNATMQMRSAVAASTGSMTVTFAAAVNSTTVAFGGGVMIFRNAAGTGATTASNGSGTPSLNLTTQQPNSAIAFAVADWNVVDSTTSRAYLAVNGLLPVETSMLWVSGDYTIHAAAWPDVGAAGSKTVGMSAPAGQKWNAGAVEVLYDPPSSNVTAELYENGVLVATLGTVPISAEGVLSFTWDPALLTAASGANVELRLTSDGDIDIGAIEWNALREVGVTITPVPVSDNPTVVVADISSLVAFLARTDTPTVGVTDTVTILVTLARTDTLSVGVTDTAALLSTLARTDTATVGITDVSTLKATLALADNPTVAIADAAVVVKTDAAVESWNSILM